MLDTKPCSYAKTDRNGQPTEGFLQPSPDLSKLFSHFKVNPCGSYVSAISPYDCKCFSVNVLMMFPAWCCFLMLFPGAVAWCRVLLPGAGFCCCAEVSLRTRRSSHEGYDVIACKFPEVCTLQRCCVRTTKDNYVVRLHSYSQN